MTVRYQLYISTTLIFKIFLVQGKRKMAMDLQQILLLQTVHVKIMFGRALSLKMSERISTMFGDYLQWETMTDGRTVTEMIPYMCSVLLISVQNTILFIFIYLQLFYPVLRIHWNNFVPNLRRVGVNTEIPCNNGYYCIHSYTTWVAWHLLIGLEILLQALDV